MTASLALAASANADGTAPECSIVAAFSQRDIRAADLYLVGRSTAETQAWAQRQDRILRAIADAPTPGARTPASRHVRSEARRLLANGNSMAVMLLPTGMHETAALVISEFATSIEIDPQMSDAEIEKSLCLLLKYRRDKVLKDGRYELAADGVNILYWKPESDPVNNAPDDTSFSQRPPAMALI